MRKLLPVSMAACVLLTLAGQSQAQDTARGVLDRAIKASGGAKSLAKYKASRGKFKGSGEFGGFTVALTGESVAQLPRQMKVEIQAEAQGQTFTVTYVLNGDKGWLKVLDKTMELKGAELADEKESLFAEHVQTLVPLRDKAFDLTYLGEIKVNERDAVGIQVASRGHKDVNLYFDKKTGLLAKTERRALNDAKQEVSEETFYSDYREVEGIQVPMKLQIRHDGKSYMELEVTEHHFVEQIDDAEFARP